MDTIQSLTNAAEIAARENNLNYFSKHYFSLLKQSKNKLNLIFALDNIFKKLGSGIEMYFSLSLADEICNAFKLLKKNEQIILQKLIQTWTYLKNYSNIYTKISELSNFYHNDSPISELYRQQPFQCKECAIRFSNENELDFHEINKSQETLSWYLNEEEWIDHKIDIKPQQANKKETKIVALSLHSVCYKCKESLEKELSDNDFYYVSVIYDNNENLIHSECS